MMDYDKMFNELDTFKKVEAVEKCCNDTDNYSFDKGIIVCKKCNDTISNIMDSPEWRFYGSEDSKNSDPTRCGMALNPLLPDSSVGTVISNQYSTKSGMYQVKKYQSWTSMTYKENSMYKVFNEIGIICKKNNLPKIILNEAKSLYKIIADTKISRGNNRKGMIAACVYFACKNCNVGRSSKEIAEMFEIKISILTKGCKNLQSTLQLSKDKNRIDTSNSVLPSDFIERFCNRLKISNDDTLKIKDLSNKIEKLNLINDIRPDSFASGCILLYCDINGLDIDKKQISEYSKISEVTINKCFKKLEANKEIIFD